MPRLIFKVRRKGLFADRRGGAAVELALLLPLLSLMLGGTFQYGMLIYSYNTMLNAARNGARDLANGSATELEVVINAKASLPAWVPKEKWVITAQNAATTGTGLVATRIAVPAKYATVLKLGPMPVNLDALVVMQKES